MNTVNTQASSLSSRRWVLLVTVAFGLLLITLDNSILYTALPTLTVDLGASASQGLWIINAYPLVMAGLLLGSGTLGDRFGHRRLFLVGLTLFGAASLVAAFSPTPEVLIGARALLAVGAACMMPATLALIRLGFDDVRERNIAIAIWGSISVVGAALGPIVGGALLERFWWGSVFLINIPVVIAALILTPLVVPAGTRDRAKKWDAISSLYALLTLTGAVLAIKEAAHTPQNWAIVAGATVVAAIGGVLFTRRQLRSNDPLLDFGVFRNRAFSAGIITAATAMFAIGGIQLVTTQRFQLVDGFTPLQAGLLVAAVAIGSLPTGILGGAFLHRLGLRIIISGGFTLATIGMIITLIGVQTAFPVFVAGLAVTGAGLGATMSVASTAVVGNVPPRKAGMAASVEEVSYEFGSLIAVAVLGSLLSLFYTSRIHLPQGAPAEAADSIATARDLASDHPGLLDAAAIAFNSGYTTIMIIIAVVIAAGVITTGWLLRQYGPGSTATAYEDNTH